MLAPPGTRVFGISVTPYAETYRDIVQQVLAAERAGLDLVGIQDHPYQRRYLDTFTLIADLLARTERISFFPDVASLPMRPPAMIAKAAASMDVMSSGRFELGLGGGTFWDAVAGMRFCGAFGIAGVFNFGRLGSTHKVVDKEARARDRRRVLQLVVYSVLIGLAVGLVAAVLPL